MKKTILSVKRTIELTKHLCCNLELLNRRRKYNSVIGIERGGVWISKWIAAHLQLPHQTIKIRFYDDDDKIKDTPIVEIAKENLIPPFILVDDIVDSGNTLKYFKEFTGFEQGMDKDFIMCVLHWVQESQVEPDMCSDIKFESQWIVYPWERVIDYSDIMELYF